uniref:Uncharacterized protein n=1 Tax=Avena sativa TaxID=4498 RepID=A0ACD5ZVH8_AVESA
MKRNLQISDTCVVCGLECEDTFHTFCRCHTARQLWDAMREVWPLKDIESITNTRTEWLLHALAQADEQTRMMMLMTFWRAWYVRNEVVHNKAPPPIEASRRFLSSYVESLMTIKRYPGADPAKGKIVIHYDRIQKKDRRQEEAKAITRELKWWSKPPPGWTKLNVDGSWKEEGNSGGTGMVLWDEDDNTIFAACRHLWTCASPLEAEVLACVEGLSLALEWTDKPIILESDCLQHTIMINAAELNRSPITAQVNEVKRLCQGGRECLIRHISREVNIVSHILAIAGCTDYLRCL